jgi:PTS system ascorbate-specific IIB component
MYQALVTCRAGLGSSLMLKIKLNEVIKEHQMDISVTHVSLDELDGYNSDMIIALSDVADDIKEKKPDKEIVGINSIVDKDEIYTKLKRAIDNLQSRK